MEKLSKLRSFDRQYRRPQNCLFQSFSHTKLRSSHRESYSFLSLSADTTMASSQGKSVSSNSFSRWTSHDIFLFKYHFLLHILRLLFFFSDNIMADVVSKQQTTALFLSATVTRTRRHTELKKKTDKPEEKPLLCQRTFISVYRAVFYTVKLLSLNYNVWSPLQIQWSVLPFRSIKKFPLLWFQHLKIMQRNYKCIWPPTRQTVLCSTRNVHCGLWRFYSDFKFVT